MRISVAMCTYNASRFLREQLDSIAFQTRPIEELVICDDGSQDNTAEIIRNFSLNTSLHVRFIQNGQNLGTARNFEKSISMCKGELIALCDQDDVWFPEKLEKLAGILEGDHTLGGAFSDAELIDEQSQPLGRRLWAGGIHPAEVQGRIRLPHRAQMLHDREPEHPAEPGHCALIASDEFVG